jgi:hypothetical protein
MEKRHSGRSGKGPAGMFFAFFGEIRCLNSLLYQFICPNGCYTIGMNGICQKFSSCLFFHADSKDVRRKKRQYREVLLMISGSVSI